MGGWAGVSYVDWNTVEPPTQYIIKLLEEFKSIKEKYVMNFINSDITDNYMDFRDTLEDASKIYYLTNEMVNGDIRFNPQILHEPWHDRYRIHPGSGRIAALWLCGYEVFKTIYIHFDEEGFVPPPNTIKINTHTEFLSHAVTDAFIQFNKFDAKLGNTRDPIDIQTYYAFPTEEVDFIHTISKDREWDPDQVQTLLPWEFIRYSEGTPFITDYKPSWRQMSLGLWEELRYDHIQLGDTEFLFNTKGKVCKLIRKGKIIDINTEVSYNE